ncbi:MAG: hypothetical protein BMS9Abin01_0172 [Gammaproteobacteria bacterium]|nr:MAG: hypothetical protein BMS9Abin01_0172 [Gammaproteobacteria bacterium]
MSKFGDRARNPKGHGLLSAIGFSIAAAFLIALGIAVIVVIIVPGVLVIGAAAAMVRWWKFRKADRCDTSFVIEGEYEVLNSGPGKSWRRHVSR